MCNHWFQDYDTLLDGWMDLQTTGCTKDTICQIKNTWYVFIHMLDFTPFSNFKYLNVTVPQPPFYWPFHHLSFHFSFFDFPFRSKHITLRVCQLSPKRLQASFLNNRSNQLPSPPLCATLLHSFPSESARGG